MRTQLHAAFAAVAVLLGSSAARAGAPFDKSKIDWAQVPPLSAKKDFAPPKPKRFKLANGINVLVVERHTLPIVSMELVVAGAGSASDPVGQTGLASITADLLDEGAGGLSALDLANEIEKLGSALDTSADMDSAFVHVSSLTRTLDKTVDLLVKVVTQPAFDAKEAERILDDSKTELLLRRDQPPSVASLVFARVLGGDTAYGHPPAGLLGDVEKLTLDDARAFYARAWQPAAMTLVVAGDVDPDKLVAMLDGKLGAWKPEAAKPVKAKGKVKLPPVTRVAVVDKPGAEQTRLMIGIQGVPRSDSRYHTIEVMTTILGGGFTSRLVQRLREQLGYTYGIRAAHRYLETTGVFAVSSGVFTPVTGESIKEIRAIIDDLTSKPVPPAELDKAKQNLIRQLPAEFDSNHEVASAFADLARYKLSDTWYDGFTAAVAKITAKDVRNLAKKLIPEKKLTYVIVGDITKIQQALDKLELGKPATFDTDGVRK
jgi:zinc protease